VRRLEHAVDLAGVVSEVKEKHDGDIVVHGSARLVQGLLEQDLVDELRLMTFPVVLGAGKRLFGETSDKKPLRLADSRTVWRRGWRSSSTSALDGRSRAA
jgi:dihydrofolate reductase